MRRTPSREALRIEHVAPDTLRPYAGNPRTISAGQMAALQRSITQFGFVDPVVVRRADRTVIGGHQRLEAAKTLGLKTVCVCRAPVGPFQAGAGLAPADSLQYDLGPVGGAIGRRILVGESAQWRSTRHR